MSEQDLPNNLIFCGHVIQREGFRYEAQLRNGAQVSVESIPQYGTWEGLFYLGDLYINQSGHDPVRVMATLEESFERTWRASVEVAGYQIVERVEV